MSWQPFAHFTIQRRFRAFTFVTAMVLFLPRKRRARSGSRSPHQTVCPCRSSNCARTEPVAPAPKTKIRMAWPKLYHRVRVGNADRLCFGGMTRGRGSAQKPLRAQIFIQFRQVVTLPPPPTLPFSPLLFLPLHQ